MSIISSGNLEWASTSNGGENEAIHVVDSAGQPDRTWCRAGRTGRRRGEVAGLLVLVCRKAADWRDSTCTNRRWQAPYRSARGGRSRRHYVGVEDARSRARALVSVRADSAARAENQRLEHGESRRCRRRHRGRDVRRTGGPALGELGLGDNRIWKLNLESGI